MSEYEEMDPKNEESKGNLGEKVGDAASNIASAPKKAENVAKTATKISEKMQETRHVKAAQSVAKVAANTQRVAAVASKLIAILGWALLIVVIIIALIGLITFLISGLGLIWNGINEISEKIGDWFTSIAKGKEHIVKQEALEEVMEYLVGMDYDLYGYGFVTAPEGNASYTISDEGKVEIKNKNYDDNSMAANPNEANPFRYLTTYLISDNYSRIIKNSNKNLDEAFKSVGNFFSGLFINNTNWRNRIDFCIL